MQQSNMLWHAAMLRTASFVGYNRVLMSHLRLAQNIVLALVPHGRLLASAWLGPHRECNMLLSVDSKVAKMLQQSTTGSWFAAFVCAWQCHFSLANMPSMPIMPTCVLMQVSKEEHKQNLCALADRCQETRKATKVSFFNTLQ